ncbi:epididymal secretory protein 4-like [Podarcis raffonei]|uniref:epididymal secretory protein 4-like n=1 Tax=Podarcis raffonei TaxID=65483 RepID=UPI00232961D6|nr:epididymal secretory protein 4-like [Podarcis raffonei]
MRPALLLVLGLSPACIFPVAAHIPVQSDFEPRKVAGLWHPVAMVSSTPEVPERDNLTAQMDHRVTVSDSGDLKLTANVMLNGTCTQTTKNLMHTNRPGIFQVPNKSTVHVMAADYDRYIIFHVTLHSYAAMYLSGRRLDVGGAIEDKFKDFALAQGFPEGNIRFFERAEQCTPQVD